MLETTKVVMGQILSNNDSTTSSRDSSPIKQHIDTQQKPASSQHSSPERRGGTVTKASSGCSSPTLTSSTPSSPSSFSRDVLQISNLEKSKSKKKSCIKMSNKSKKLAKTTTVIAGPSHLPAHLQDHHRETPSSTGSNSSGNHHHHEVDNRIPDREELDKMFARSEFVCQ